MMPEGAVPRGRSSSTLSSIRHDMVTDEETGDLLDELADADLTDERAAVVRDPRLRTRRRRPRRAVEERPRRARKRYRRRRRKPRTTSTRSHPTEKHVEPKREYAEHIDPDRDPTRCSSRTSRASMERGVDPEELRETLDPYDRRDPRVRRRPAVDTFERNLPRSGARRRWRARRSNWSATTDRGRLDVSHPFTAGNQFDCRVTTDSTSPTRSARSARRSTSSATRSTTSGSAGTVRDPARGIP